MNNIIKIVGTYVVAYYAADLVIKGIDKGVEYAQEKIDEFKKNRNLREDKKGKVHDDFIDVEHKVYG